MPTQRADNGQMADVEVMEALDAAVEAIASQGIEKWPTWAILLLEGLENRRPTGRGGTRWLCEIGDAIERRVSKGTWCSKALVQPLYPSFAQEENHGRD